MITIDHIENRLGIPIKALFRHIRHLVAQHFISILIYLLWRFNKILHHIYKILDTMNSRINFVELLGPQIYLIL